MLAEKDVHGFLAAADCVNKIESMERAMSTHPQLDIPVEEYFFDGLYARKIFIPADTILTGRVYKHDYVDIMLDGDISVVIPSGTHRLTGFNICDGKAGRKRAGYAYQDTNWITVHKVDEIEPDMKEALSFFSIGEYSVWADQQDFLIMLDETGFTADQVDTQTRNESDRIDIELVDVELSPSPINKIGMFAKRKFASGEVVMPARINGKRTQAGRYVNHSKTPNATMFIEDNNIYLRVISDVSDGEELTVDYRQSVAVTRSLCQV